MKAPRPSPTFRKRAGSGTFPSTTTWSASASSPRANISPATASKSPEAIFKREIEQNALDQRSPGRGRANRPLLHHRRIHLPCETLRDARVLLLAGDAFCFLDPVFSSGLMFALKSGVHGGRHHPRGACPKATFSPSVSTEYGRMLRQGIENMRKLVYAFYDQEFQLPQTHRQIPGPAGEVTDCLSGDVNKDFSQLWAWVSEFV